VNWHFFALNHTVTFDAPNAGTPAGIAVTSNATVSRTFTTPGSYAYHCEIHGGMTGTVIVH
jgi:plastocyanin